MIFEENVESGKNGRAKSELFETALVNTRNQMGGDVPDQ